MADGLTQPDPKLTTESLRATKPDCVCALSDLLDPSVLPHGWVLIKRDVDGMGGFGLKYTGDDDLLATHLAALERLEAAETYRTRGDQGEDLIGPHFDPPALLRIVTHRPKKWRMVDLETGQVWRDDLGRMKLDGYLPILPREWLAGLAALAREEK